MKDKKQVCPACEKKVEVIKYINQFKLTLKQDIIERYTLYMCPCCFAQWSNSNEVIRYVREK